MSKDKNNSNSHKSHSGSSGSGSQTPFRDKQESSIELNRDCPAGGSNRGNNISQYQMTPPRPNNGGKK